MKRASFIILSIIIGIVLNAQEQSLKRIPISFNIGWAYHYHVQQIYPEDVDHFSLGMKITQMDVNYEVAYHAVTGYGYKLIKPTEDSDFDMIEYAESNNGFKVEVDCQPYKSFFTGIGFQYSPHARDRYSYYIKLGAAVSTKQKRFYCSPYLKIGGRKYQWKNLQQQNFFAGFGLDLDIRIIKNFLLDISFSCDQFHNEENWEFIKYQGFRPIYYKQTISYNVNWILTGSVGIKYRILDN